MQYRFFFPAFLAFLLSAALPAQESVTTAEQQAVVDSLSRQLRESYVFPAVAAEMADLITRKQAGGQYRSLTDVHSFANQLTEDLQSVSHDKHLRVLFNPDLAQPMRRPPADDEDEDQGPPPEMLRDMQRDNYGFKEVKILEGNVGYLDLRGFMPPAYAGEAAAAWSTTTAAGSGTRGRTRSPSRFTPARIPAGSGRVKFTIRPGEAGAGKSPGRLRRAAVWRGNSCFPSADNEK